MRGESTLESIEIKNVRSLKDTGLQSIAPITLLVGENSSGKSTFLRTFPLFRQSIEKKTSGPLLWVGDNDDYVDFGSFDETITENESEMEFLFRFTYLPNNNYPLVAFFGFDETDLQIYPEQITYKIVIRKGDSQEIVSKAFLKIGDNSLVIDTLEQRFYLNDKLIDSFIAPVDGDRVQEMISSPFAVGTMQESIFGYNLPRLDRYLRTVYCKWYAEEETQSESKQSVKNMSLSMLRMYLSCVGQWLVAGYTLEQIYDSLDNTDNSQNNRFEWAKNEIKHLLSISKEDDADSLKIINSLSILCYFYSSFEDIENYVGRCFRNVHYIAPVRATAERYYRSRNLAVDEIDYQGKNLSVFLNSLSKERLRQFQRWTREHFGFKVVVKAFEGNLSLRIIIDGSNREVNLSDTGFGYSQILPIITQLWDLSTKQDKNKEKIPLMLAIEQPELHLHPAMQVKLAKAFIASIQLAENNNIELQLLLETHSETIVNYFGSAIAKGHLNPDDVNIILFNKDKKSNLSNVQSSGYDDMGYLKDWPVGFFSPED